MSDVVRTDRVGGVLVITIDRPEARNAINRAVSVGVAEAVDRLDDDASLSVGVLTGAGGTFCAGMDLKAFLAGENARPDGRGLAGICRRRPQKPLIAAVEGWALAGGCEVALACDLIVAAEDARFGIPEVKRGLIAGDGGLVRLPRKLPPGIAMELALTGDPLSAVDAHAHGMVNRLTPSGGALKEALELAARVAANAPMAVSASRQIVADALDSPVSDGMRAVDGLMESIMASYDAREGALAFAEKRAPVWRNR